MAYFNRVKNLFITEGVENDPLARDLGVMAFYHLIMFTHYPKDYLQVVEFEIFLKSLGFKDLNEYLRLENIKKADIWENYETCEGCGKVFYNSNDNTVQKGISYNWNGDFYCIDCQDWETVIQDYMNTGEIIVQMCDYLREELERQGFKYKENTVIFTMEKEILDKYINKDIEDYLKIYSTRPNSIELWSRTKEN